MIKTYLSVAFHSLSGMRHNGLFHYGAALLQTSVVAIHSVGAGKVQFGQVRRTCKKIM